MTPYVANDDQTPGAGTNKKPRSIMVHPVNGNGILEHQDHHHQQDVIQEDVTTTDVGHVEPIKPLLNGRGKGLHNGHAKGGKAGALKRVSFGSSKGSMVETLVYDHNDDLHFPRLVAPGGMVPLYPHNQPTQTHQLPSHPQVQKDNHQISHTTEDKIVDLTPHRNGEEAPLLPSRVKVSFFESQKPNYVTTPESPDIPLDFLNLSSNMSTPPVPGTDYERQESTESGLDNPFRPDGELSREADTIVSLIKEGKPITPVKGEPDGGGYFGEDVPDGHTTVIEDSISPVKSKSVEANAKSHGANGNTPKDKPKPGVVEVQHGVVVPPSDASQVEQVVIKKKPKCKCCVIQ